MTQLWRANTDFSPITSKEAVLRYISKYAPKGEFASSSYSEIMEKVITRNQNGALAATIVRSLLVSSVAERNFSAHEVVHLVMGLDLYKMSRAVVLLSWGSNLTAK